MAVYPHRYFGEDIILHGIFHVLLSIERPHDLVSNCIRWWRHICVLTLPNGVLLEDLLTICVMLGH
jgi:hypothetical protein